MFLRSPTLLGRFSKNVELFRLVRFRSSGAAVSQHHVPLLPRRFTFPSFAAGEFHIPFLGPFLLARDTLLPAGHPLSQRVNPPCFYPASTQAPGAENGAVKGSSAACAAPSSTGFPETLASTNVHENDPPKPPTNAERVLSPPTSGAAVGISTPPQNVDNGMKDDCDVSATKLEQLCEHSRHTKFNLAWKHFNHLARTGSLNEEHCFVMLNISTPTQARLILSKFKKQAGQEPPARLKHAVITVYNHSIQRIAEAKRTHPLRRMYDAMLRYGLLVRPNTFYLFFSSLPRGVSLGDAFYFLRGADSKQLHEVFVRFTQVYVSVLSKQDKLTSALAEGAVKSYLSTCRKTLLPNSALLSLLLAAARSENRELVRKATNMLLEQRGHVKGGRATATMIQCLSDVGDYENVRWVHSLLVRQTRRRELEQRKTAVCLLKAYADSGNVEQVCEMIDETPILTPLSPAEVAVVIDGLGRSRHTVGVNLFVRKMYESGMKVMDEGRVLGAMMKAFARNGECSQVHALYERMKRLGVGLDRDDLECVLECYVEMDERTRAKGVFSMIPVLGFSPSKRALRCMVKVYERDGQCEELEVVTKMLSA